MIKHPAKDPVSIALGVLVAGILIFLAYQCILLENSLSHHRHEIHERDVRWQRIFSDVQAQVVKSLSVSQGNQQEILRSREVSKENNEALRQIETRLDKIQREINALHPGSPVTR